MPKYHIRTIKLKLTVIAEDKKQAWKRIRQIMNDAWKAANWISSGQYLNDQLIRRIYSRRKINTQDEDAVRAVEEEFRAFFEDMSLERSRVEPLNKRAKNLELFPEQDFHNQTSW